MTDTIQDLDGSQPVTGTPILVLVHGTLTGDPAIPPKPLYWWEKDSEFRLEMTKVLGLAIPGRTFGFKVFRWPVDARLSAGPNSEFARRQAGVALFERIRDWQARGHDIHLIGHSHGGSVILHALSQSLRHGQTPLPGIKSWTTAGTPFLRFSPAWGEIFGNVLALLLLILLMGIIMGPGYGFLEFMPEFHLMRENAPLLSMGTAIGWWQNLWQSMATAAVGLLFAITSGIFILRLVPHKDGSGNPRLLLGVAYALPPLLIIALLLLLADVDRGAIAKEGLPILQKDMEAGVVLVVIAYILCWTVFFLLAWETIRAGGVLVRNKRYYALQERAAKVYGPLWLGLFHPDDEATALIATSLQRSPRLSQRGPLFDQLAWRTLTEMVQGDDCDYERLAACSNAPHGGALPLVPLSVEAADRQRTASLETLTQSVSAIWRLLFEERHVVSMQDPRSLAAKMSFRGAVHSAYFDIAEEQTQTPMNLLIGQIISHITTPGGWRTDMTKRVALSHEVLPPAPVVSDLSLVKASPDRFYWVTGIRNSTILGAVTVLSAGWAVMQEGYITPLAHTTQMKTALAAWRERPSLFATSDANVAAAYVVRVASHEGIKTKEDLAGLLGSILQINTNAAIAQRLALFYGYGSSNKIKGAAFEKLGRDLIELYQYAARTRRNAYRERQAALAEMSFELGKALRTNSILPEVMGRMNALHVQKFIHTTGSAPIFNCGDIDYAAYAALRFLLLALAGDYDVASAQADDAARLGGAGCLPVVRRDSDALTAAEKRYRNRFVIERASDLASWGHADRARRILNLVGADPFEGASESNSALTLRAMYVAQITPELEACKAATQELRKLLVPASNTPWIEDGSEQANTCKKARQGVSFTTPSAQFKPSDVTGHCRAQPPALLGQLRQIAAARSQTCSLGEQAEEFLWNIAGVLDAGQADNESIANVFRLLFIAPPSGQVNLRRNVSDRWIELLDQAPPRIARILQGVLLESLRQEQTNLKTTCHGPKAPTGQGPAATDASMRAAALLVTLLANDRPDCAKTILKEVLIRYKNAEHLSSLDLHRITQALLRMGETSGEFGAVYREIVDRISLGVTAKDSSELGDKLLHTTFRIDQRPLVRAINVFRKSGEDGYAENALRRLELLASGAYEADSRAQVRHAISVLLLQTGNAFAALRSAFQGGSVPGELATLCEVLGRASGPDRLGPLSGKQRWPQLVPVFYGNGDRFGYDEHKSGPFTCSPGLQHELK